ncbi:MAG: ABC transporter permease, partial [Lachnospiraceae bacterium]|nr:ABC transporter permease [Lachnospiraceae bacterium]
QVFYEGYGISESIAGLFLVQSGIPAELLSKGPSAMERGEYTATEDGRIALKSGDRMYLLEMNAEGNLGETECRFRVFDPVTGEAGEAAASTSAYFLNVRAELKLENAPDGCVRPSGISLVLPLSKALASVQVRLGIRIRELSDYYPLLAKLKALTKDNLLVYNDFRENDMNLLGLAALIRGISTGFLILVALFCAINVFYTLSTNLMLRRRDFGVLQSIGFTRRDLFRMAAVESTGSGFKALFIGLPVGIGLCYALFRMGNVGITSAVFHLPWEALLLGLSLIAVLMLAGIIYSLHFLRRQSPLEAIRRSETS